MKKFRNIALGILIASVIIIVGCLGFYRLMISAPSSDKTTKEVEIPANSSSKQIASILKEQELIRDDRVFLIYLKLNNVNDLKAGYYDLSPSMGVEKIVATLREGSTKNPNEIQITFQEGLNIREIATIISDHTSNSYEEVIAKTNDEEYINQLMEKYWFIDESVKQEGIYYDLEGYLFPDTYKLTNRDVDVEYIFNRMLEEMNRVLTPHKEAIEASGFTPHEILTLASMVEEESANKQDRNKVASVFLNRLKISMPLGSDVTTRYANQIDNKGQALTAAQYALQNPYNTRLTNGTMDGKLPIGPICSPSEEAIEAALYPDSHNYLYFIANIQTLETFFYEDYASFLAKKNELAAVNGGL